MFSVRSGSVVYGAASPRMHRLAARLWLVMVAAVAVVGAIVLVAVFKRADAKGAVTLFNVSRDVAAAAEPTMAAPLIPIDQAPASTAETAAVHHARPAIETVQPTGGEQFNGMAVHPTRTIRMLVTAYCPCSKCCGKHADGKTASGYSVWVNDGKMVAADTRVLPFGSLLSIPGYHDGEIVPVLDRGGRIKGHRLDVLFPSHREAQRFGKRWVDVTVYALDQ